jgi:hypothetical protein
MAVSGNSAHTAIMDEDHRRATLKTVQLLLLLILTFTLGKYSVQFSIVERGLNGLEWTALVLFLFGGCFVGLLYLLVRGFWSAHG